MKVILKDGLINHIYTEEGGCDWVESCFLFGQTALPAGIACRAETEIISDSLVRQKFVFSNTTDREIFVRRGDIGIYTPFNEDYRDSPTCMSSRCHTHLFCGRNIFYIMALRMGGYPPNLGLFLTEGDIDTYSIVRAENSNDRGDFIIHPSPFVLPRGGEYVISWDIFTHEGREDFYSKISAYRRSISFVCEKFVFFEGEKIVFRAEYGDEIKDAFVTAKNAAVSFDKEKNALSVTLVPEGTGEIECTVKINGTSLRVRFFVSPTLEKLLAARTRFIAEKQQYHSAGSPLDGAYLIYDNEEERIFYTKEYDYNGGRERIAMGILIAKYLQNKHDTHLEKSLREYADYFLRELFDEKSGIVYNDVCRDNEWHRLYNYPWAVKFCLELYRLWGDNVWLERAYSAMREYYNQGGGGFYAFKIPMVELCSALSGANMTARRDEVLALFKAHAETIISNGTNYPAHEVRFEQSIVAPAAEIMLAMYELTREEKYSAEAKKHLDILALFNSSAPDHRLYETAIRHWDGFWFGKNKLYGDTLPHYWSALSGDCFMTYYRLTGDETYKTKARANLLATLSLFDSDGRATCAPLFPFTVNGRRGEYRDPYANDQDWALIFIMDNIY